MVFLDNRIDPKSGTIRARAEFDNKDGALTPGLFARVRLLGGDSYKAVMTPERAIGTDQSKRFVLVVGADGIAQFREVKLGALVDGSDVANTCAGLVCPTNNLSSFFVALNDGVLALLRGDGQPGVLVQKFDASFVAVPGDKVGLLNRVFSVAYYVRLPAKAIKRWNKYVYYAGKWALLAAIVYAVFFFR